MQGASQRPLKADSESLDCEAPSPPPPHAAKADESITTSKA